MQDINIPIPFFRRTSTHDVLSIIFEGKNNFDLISQEMKKKKHSRKDNDIKFMIRTLERVGLVNNYNPTEFGYKVKAFIQSIQGNDKNLDNFIHDNLQKITAAEILKEFYHKGFLITPFLRALNQSGTNQMISARFFDEAKKVGIYNINEETDFNDFVSAMKNFAVFLGLATKTQKRGKIQLTALCKDILTLNASEISDRKQCEEELCRKICPAGAINADYITGCVNCGLCARCCPYSAINCKTSKIEFDFNICASKIRNKSSYMCHLQPNLSEIMGSERIMQQWVVSLFKILKIQAIVPGPGRTPDIVLNRTDFSSIIECKNNPIRGLKVDKLEDQLLSYMTPKVLDSTKNTLFKQWHFNMKPPDVFYLLAPNNSEVDRIIDQFRNNGNYPVSFVSSEVIFELHKALLKQRKFRTDKIQNLFALKNQNISPDLYSIIKQA